MDCHTGYEEIHYNKMAHTSQHHKDMKYFVGAEILMLRIEDRKLQRIDHTADGIDDAAGKEPAEACTGQIVEDRNKSKYTQPAHSNVDHRGKPFWAVDPAALEDHSDDGNGPYEGTEDIAGASVENDQAYRSVAAGDHHKDHHVIHFFQTAVHLDCRVYGMVKCACQVKKDHGKDKNTYCKNMENVCASGRLHDQRSGSGHGKKHADSVGYGTSRIF